MSVPGNFIIRVMKLPENFMATVSGPSQENSRKVHGIVQAKGLCSIHVSAAAHFFSKDR